MAEFSWDSFDAADQDTSQRSTLPNGIYDLEVSEAELKPTKGNTGHLLAVTYDVLAPEGQKGRKFFSNINVANQNPTAQKIGQEELGKLCRAMGIRKPSGPQALQFQRFTAKVGLEKAQEGYDQKNKIVRFYYPDEGDVPQPAIDANQPAAAPKPANDNRQAPANDNAPAKAPARTAAAGGKNPWSK